MRFVFLLFTLTWTFCLNGQKVDLEKYNCDFISPVDHKIKLSGTFAELRRNHFHAGIDIKSKNGGDGDPIRAVASGYVSRIKVQRGSYGQTVYIDHSCGLTSVYAHLKSFNELIDSFITAEQYSRKRFEVDFYPGKGLINVTQGDVIGRMGKTGRAFGTHLHFELRETNREIPVNPMSFDIGRGDNRKPIISAVSIRRMDGHNNPSEHSTSVKHGDTIEADTWRIGVAVKTFDRQNSSQNKNGIYQIKMNVDGELKYSFLADHCSFSETHNIKAHIDFHCYYHQKQMWHRCYLLDGNDLSMYENVVENGIVTLQSNKFKKIKLIVGDFEGNESSVHFWVRRKKNIPSQKGQTYHALFEYDKDNYFSINGMELNCPKGVLFSNLKLKISMPSRIDSSRKFIIGSGDQPLKGKIDFSLNMEKLNWQPELRKLTLMYYDARSKKWSNCGGKIVEGIYKVRIGYLGEYKFVEDKTAPTIKRKKGRSDQFIVKDDLAVSGEASEIFIEAYLDDEWLIPTFDAKSHTLKLKLPTRKTGKLLRIRAVDDLGNERVAEW